MPTQINKIIPENSGSTLFRVSGEMFIDDALLLDKIVRQTIDLEKNEVAIDLADLTFMDSDAAGILRRLQEETNASIEGIEIFLQAAIDTAERTGGQ